MLIKRPVRTCTVSLCFFISRSVHLININLENTTFRTSQILYSAQNLNHIGNMCDKKQFSSPIKDYYKNKSVFLTGGTGFLGMVIMEKLLYSCDLKNIYMLIKPKKGKNIEERLLSVLDTEAFQRIRKEKPDELKKIVPIPGDLLEKNLGLSDFDRDKLNEEVSIVFHSAANINLNMQLINAININTKGAEKLVKLCKEMKRLEAFVYVSSAYSQSNKEVIDEVVYSTKCKLESFSYVVDHLDGNALEKNLIEHRPNTYTHSKALAEEIISAELDTVPVAIIRPSGITSALKEPVPGWLYGWSGINLIVMSCGKGLLRCWHGDPDKVCDVIPVDMVSNVSIAAAWDVAINRCTDRDSAKVFNICVSLQNPLTLGRLLWSHVKYGKKHYKRETIVPPFLLIVKYKLLYDIISFFLQSIPAYFISWVEYIFGRQPRMSKLHQKIMDTGKVLGFFGLHQFLLNDYNVNKLLCSMEKFDRETFNFDVKILEWDEYFESFVLAIKKFLLREIER